MNQKTYLNVTMIIFLIIAVLHLARTFLGWEVSMAGWMVPAWVSWVALVASGYLAYSGYSLSKQT